MVISTGYALFGMRGASGTCNRQDLVFRIGPRWAAVRGTAVVVSPSSMFNKNVATDAGWAVDRVRLTYFSQTPGPAGVQVELRCGLAVSDSDGFLFRVNYHVTTVGQLAEQPGAVDLGLTSAAELVSRRGAEQTA